jgi:hypothetical protein
MSETDNFVSTHLAPFLSGHGFVRTGKSFVRRSPTRSAAIVVTVRGSRWNLARLFSNHLGVPNHVDLELQLFVGVEVPASPKKMIAAFPQSVGQTPASVCAYMLGGVQFRTRDDDLNAAAQATGVPGPGDVAAWLTEEIAPLLSIDSIDNALRWCSERDGASPFMLATLLATIGRHDEARALFRHPASGAPAHVATFAARFGITLG